MVMTLSGAVQHPLVRSPVSRQHSIAELAAGARRCFVPELMILMMC